MFGGLKEWFQLLKCNQLFDQLVSEVSNNGYLEENLTILSLHAIFSQFKKCSLTTGEKLSSLPPAFGSRLCVMPGT